MYTFLLLSIPALTIGFCACTPCLCGKAAVPPILFGGLTATAACIIEKFFLFSTYIWTDNPLASFLHLALMDCLLPVACGCLPFYLLARDSAAYKVAALAPLLGAFHAVFIPYAIISGPDRHAPFMLVAKPLLSAAEGIIVARLAEIPAGTAGSAMRFAAIPLMPIALLFPPAMEVLWYYGGDSPAWLIPAAAFSLLAVILLPAPAKRPSEKGKSTHKL